jgi:hypothetical protein
MPRKEPVILVIHCSRLIEIVIRPVIDISFFNKPTIRDSREEVYNEPGLQVVSDYGPSFHDHITFLVVACYEIED